MFSVIVAMCLARRTARESLRPSVAALDTVSFKMW